VLGEQPLDYVASDVALTERCGGARPFRVFKSDEPGFGKGGTGVLKVDDNEVANQKIPPQFHFS
jgi:hypothetical protein